MRRVCRPGRPVLRLDVPLTVEADDMGTGGVSFLAPGLHGSWPAAPVLSSGGLTLLAKYYHNGVHRRKISNPKVLLFLAEEIMA